MTATLTSTTLETPTVDPHRPPEPTRSPGGSRSQPIDIDLLDPATTLDRLAINEAGLLGLVNQGELAAYRLGGELRFRRRDVDTLARLA